MRNESGFTLIELLIVVAIIGILAAIAIPNLLQAQVRAKIARVKADMHTVVTAMELYAVDHNDYPPGLAPFYLNSADPNPYSGRGCFKASFEWEVLLMQEPVGI